MVNKRLFQPKHAVVLGIFSLFVLLLTSGAGAGVYEQWSKTYGGTDDSEARSVVQASDGGYVFAGGINSSDGIDAWLVKTDANGNELWNKTFGGAGFDEIYSLQNTSDGGYILAGATGLTGNLDVWLIKTDANGNELWNRTFGGSGLDVTPAVQQTSDGGYVLAGETNSSGKGGLDVWLIKTDGYGNEIWNRTFGGSNDDAALSVQQTSDGGYILAGGTNSFGNGDSWLIRTDARGIELWNKTFGPNQVYSARQTSDGGYILAGYGYSFYTIDAIVIKTDLNGNRQWEGRLRGGEKGDVKYEKGRGDARFCCVQQTSDGGYILAGGAKSSETGYVVYDTWLIKTDADAVNKGLGLWGRTFGEIVNEEMAYSAQPTSDGGYILAGISQSFDNKINYSKTNALLIKVGGIDSTSVTSSFIAESFYNITTILSGFTASEVTYIFIALIVCIATIRLSKDKCLERILKLRVPSHVLTWVSYVAGASILILLVDEIGLFLEEWGYPSGPLGNTRWIMGIPNISYFLYIMNLVLLVPALWEILRSESYLFSWNKVPGSDNERLQGYLKDYLNIRWAANTKIEKARLFSWDEIPGNDNERLIDFLGKKFSFDWVRTAKIEKTDDSKTIRVSTEKNFLSLRLNDEKTKVDLRIDDNIADELIVKKEKDKRIIYDKTIRIFTDKNQVEITLDDKNETATLKIGDEKTYDLHTEDKNGQLEIYDSDCKVEEKKQLDAVLILLFVNITLLMTGIQLASYKEVSLNGAIVLIIILSISMFYVSAKFEKLQRLMFQNKRQPVEELRHWNYISLILGMTFLQTMITKAGLLLVLISKTRCWIIRFISSFISSLTKVNFKKHDYYQIKIEDLANSMSVFNTPKLLGFYFLCSSGFTMLLFFQFSASPFPPTDSAFPKTETVSLIYTLDILLFLWALTSKRFTIGAVAIASVILIISRYLLPFIAPELFMPSLNPPGDSAIEWFFKYGPAFAPIFGIMLHFMVVLILFLESEYLLNKQYVLIYEQFEKLKRLGEVAITKVLFSGVIFLIIMGSLFYANMIVVNYLCPESLRLSLECKKAAWNLMSNLLSFSLIFFAILAAYIGYSNYRKQATPMDDLYISLREKGEDRINQMASDLPIIAHFGKWRNGHGIDWFLMYYSIIAMLIFLNALAVL